MDKQYTVTWSQTALDELYNIVATLQMLRKEFIILV
jgi:hypothetical protein